MRTLDNNGPRAALVRAFATAPCDSVRPFLQSASAVGNGPMPSDNRTSTWASSSSSDINKVLPRCHCQPARAATYGHRPGTSHVPLTSSPPEPQGFVAFALFVGRQGGDDQPEISFRSMSKARVRSRITGGVASPPSRPATRVGVGAGRHASAVPIEVPSWCTLADGQCRSTVVLQQGSMSEVVLLDGGLP
jgi:hypothetical protein